MAFAMQYLLLSWLLIGVLELPADQVGLIQALVGIPGIFLMLWGGASADRRDPRALLIQVYLVAPLFPLFLIAMNEMDRIDVWTVSLWGVGMSVITSFSAPAQQAILNRVSGDQVQRGVSAATAVGFLVQMTGLSLAGQIDNVGLSAVLVIQGACLMVGAAAVRRISPVPPPDSGGGASAVATVVAGLKATLSNRVVFHILLINFISSIFNAGAFMTVFPFIIKRVYDGDAVLLAIMMTVFYAGATFSNLVMYRLMPFSQPGRLFLVMQLSRIAILVLLWIEPSWWLLVIATVAWGVNMGFTQTLARSIVQESAEAAYRGRILSVFALGMLGSAPIGAVVLGWMIEAVGTLNALIPAMAVSLALFAFGSLFSSVWQYRSPGTEPATS
jgi:predicted MFS family arabinose efflux permease